MKRYLIGVLVLVALSVPYAACALAASDAANPNPGVTPLNAKVGGLTYSEWGDRWWEWVLSIPEADSPLVDLTGEKAGIGQSGDVFFLVGLYNPAGQASVERWITVPHKTTLFFPLMNFIWWKAEMCYCDWPEQDILDMMYGDLDWLVSCITDLHASVDGQPLQDLFSYRATSSEPFVGTYPEDSILSEYLGPDPGILDINVADGYWLMLSPLKKGEHIVTFGGNYSWGDSLDVTYHITVR